MEMGCYVSSQSQQRMHFVKKGRLVGLTGFRSFLYRVATAEFSPIRNKRTIEQARKTTAELEAMVQQFVVKVD